jgi:hypothetical protein
VSKNHYRCCPLPPPSRYWNPPYCYYSTTQVSAANSRAHNILHHLGSTTSATKLRTASLLRQLILQAAAKGVLRLQVDPVLPLPTLPTPHQEHKIPPHGSSSTISLTQKQLNQGARTHTHARTHKHRNNNMRVESTVKLMEFNSTNDILMQLSPNRLRQNCAYIMSRKSSLN